MVNQISYQERLFRSQLSSGALGFLPHSVSRCFSGKSNLALRVRGTAAQILFALCPLCRRLPRPVGVANSLRACVGAAQIFLALCPLCRRACPDPSGWQILFRKEAGG